MTEFDACEQAYKKGYEEGLKDASPKKGEWIDVWKREDQVGWICSRCHFKIDVNLDYNFCPNCGAKMI